MIAAGALARTLHALESHLRPVLKDFDWKTAVRHQAPLQEKRFSVIPPSLSTQRPLIEEVSALIQKQSKMNVLVTSDPLACIMF